MAILNGTAGNDVLDGSGYTQVNGLAGNDTISAGPHVGLDGGPGFDRLNLDLTSLFRGLVIDLRPALTGGISHVAGAAVTGFEAIGTIIATPRDDRVHLGNVGGTLLGWIGDDQLFGGRGNDTIYGGDGADRVSGGAGDDVLWGGNGPPYGTDGTLDTILGGAGRDTIHAGFGDTVDGGGGRDTLWYDCDWAPAGVTVDLRGLAAGGTVTLGGGTITRVEAIASFTGSPFADTIHGWGPGGTLAGGDGNDTLTGGAGADTLYGGAGRDILRGGFGNDTLWGADDAGEADTLYGGAGDDVIHAGYADTVYGGPGNDTLILAMQQPADAEWGVQVDLSGWTPGATLTLYGATIAGIETIAELAGGSLGDTLILGENVHLARGMAGNDVLIGGTGADTLYGGDDNDTLHSQGSGADTGTAIDTLYGDAGRNTFYAGIGDRVFGSGIDTLYLSLAGASAGVVADFTQVMRGKTVTNAAGTFSGIFTIAQIDGSAFADTITVGKELYGSGGATVLGKGGDDVLIGGGGNDRLDGGIGRDTLTGGGGADTFQFSTGAAIGNDDTITDFQHGLDHVAILRASLAGLAGTTAGALDPALLALGPIATTAQQRLVYDHDSGTLWYDRDGSGSAAPIVLAHLGAGTVFDAGDVVLI